MTSDSKSKSDPFNLFVYGTLMDPWVFRAVLGRRLVFTAADADGVSSFHARDAVLDGYKKISPDNTYLYAAPDPQGRIRGYIVGPLPPDCMTALRKYEGKNYSRRKVRVHTRTSVEKAYAFLANEKELAHSFGYAFEDPLKQEILLREKIDNALVEAERQQLHTDDDTGRRAMEELHGATIRDLVRRHFQAGGISNYAIRHSLTDAPLRDFQRVIRDDQARALAPNYLSLVIRQVIFNQVEERIRKDFRYELDRLSAGEEYYERTFSALTALAMLNWYGQLLDLLVGDCIGEISFSQAHLVDFVRWSIIAADAIYDPNLARQQIESIRTHTGRGYIPLGAELEFSNIGHAVINDPQGDNVRDRQYDGFLYFSDFGLDVLTWKLGGHIDDHHVKSSARPRRGFFELALGNLSIEANLSKPITNDPWMLNQFIHQARRFYNIAPHSVHISLQLRSQHLRPALNRLMPLNSMKCLLAIGGDPRPGADGRTFISRLRNDEIAHGGEAPSMLLSSISRRHSSADEDGDALDHRRRISGRYVQQYKFLRLSPHLSYEPLAMALKGIQLSQRQGTFLTPAQYRSSQRHRHFFHELMDWGAQPEPISDRYIERFLTHVYDGLMTERRGKPAHGEAYIAWSLSQLRNTIKAFNSAVAASQSAPAGAGMSLPPSAVL